MALGDNIKFKKEKLLKDNIEETASAMKEPPPKKEERPEAAPVKAKTPSLSPTPSQAETEGSFHDSFRRQTRQMLEDREYTLKQLNRVLFALDAFKKGDISVRLPKEEDDIFADIAEAY